MKRIILLPIEIYKRFVSTGLKGIFGGGCRFSPTCSAYAQEAVEKYGAVKGSLLGLKRFLSCHPFGKSGYDPII